MGLRALEILVINKSRENLNSHSVWDNHRRKGPLLNCMNTEWTPNNPHGLLEGSRATSSRYACAHPRIWSSTKAFMQLQGATWRLEGWCRVLREHVPEMGSCLFKNSPSANQVSTDQLCEVDQLTNSSMTSSNDQLRRPTLRGGPADKLSDDQLRQPTLQGSRLNNSIMTNSDDQLSVNRIRLTNSPSSNPTRQRCKSSVTDPHQLRRDASPSSHVRLCAQHAEWELGSLRWPAHRMDETTHHTEPAPTHDGRWRRAHDDKRSHATYDRTLRLIRGTRRTPLWRHQRWTRYKS
jgi:hypothetical protein